MFEKANAFPIMFIKQKNAKQVMKGKEVFKYNFVAVAKQTVVMITAQVISVFPNLYFSIKFFIRILIHANNQYKYSTILTFLKTKVDRFLPYYKKIAINNQTLLNLPYSSLMFNLNQRSNHEGVL